MGRIPEADRKAVTTPTLAHLWPHHRSMARAMVAAGLTPSQLAIAYGFTAAQISRIINSPMFQVELRRLEGLADETAIDVKADIKRMCVRALETIDEDLNKVGVDARLRQKAAFNVLDRGGYGKQDRPIQVGGDLNVTKVDIREMSDKDLKDEVIDLVEGKDFG